MTQEEIIPLLCERNRNQFYDYPDEVKLLITKHFNPVFYSKKRDLQELFSSFTMWYTIPESEYPYNQPLSATYEQIKEITETQESLSENEQIALYKFQQYISSLSINKQSLFLQQLNTNWKK